VRSGVGTGNNLPTGAVPVLDEGLGRAVGIDVLEVEAHGNTRVDILFGETVIPQGNLWLVGNEFGRTPVLNATGQ
jgi:hypothetical protein